MATGLLPFDEARARVLALAPAYERLANERVSLHEARGRVLAEDVRAPSNLPPFDYSAMDGYALRASDLAAATARVLPVRGESRTGAKPGPLAVGATCRIFTGAEIPDGADTVVMQERVERRGEDAHFASVPGVGDHIRRRGEDLRQGATALARGTRLRASQVALAAMCDRAWLLVARRPVVTLLSTGDELRPPGGAAPAGADVSTIPDSNGPALRAMAEAAGANARIAPSVPDEREATVAAFERALGSSDVVVTIGGVSVGEHDLVRPALDACGVTLDFWRIAIKPGKPLAVGRRGGTLVLGLPGNPASALVTFALFGVPLLRALQGDAEPVPSPLRARLATTVKQEPGRRAFLRAVLERHRSGGGAQDEAPWVRPLANQASGAATSMAEADALVVIPETAGVLDAGTWVDVYLAAELGL